MNKYHYRPRANIITETFAATAEEEARRVNQQAYSGSGMKLVEDPEHWARYDIHTGEELALYLLSQTYSDMYKELHGIRPRWAKFDTPAEAQEALDDLDRVYEDMELNAKEQAEYEEKEREIQALMPGPHDHEDIPRRSGMGRRVENKVQFTKGQLRKIIKEAMRGEVMTHPLTNLARSQAKTFGHGRLVDENDYMDLIGTGIDFSRGKAGSPLRLSERKLRSVIRKTLGNMNT